MSLHGAEVVVIRGPVEESRHSIAVAVADAAGRLVAGCGNPHLVTYLRSSAKPLQALALVETGAVEAFGIQPAEIAVACASHSGEDVHVAAVRSLLRRAGLSEAALNCGVHPPVERESALRILRSGAGPTEVHCNCSGKHAGMLTTCRQLGWDLEGYWRPDHPLQQLLLANVAAMAGLPVGEIAIGVDGCGVPVHGMPLVNMATAFARLADSSGLEEVRQCAAKTVVQAMQAHPYLVAGKGRFDTALMEVARPRVAAKSGAEALFCVALPELGLGLALKVMDGGSRAVAPATMAVLDQLGAVTGEDLEELRNWRRPPVQNVLGQAVGHLEARIALDLC